MATDNQNETLLELAQTTPPLQPNLPNAAAHHSVLKISAIFLVASVLSYTILVGPSLWVKFRYFVTHLGPQTTAEPVVDVKASNSNFAAAVASALASDRHIPRDATNSTTNNTPAPTSTATPKALLPTQETLTENVLVIPKINVRVPIIWNSSADEPTVLANLQHGVVHYGFTSLPNESSGNVFISGHSSYYWWDKGKYKTVFALLNKLSPGDQILLEYEGKNYVYQVADSVVVKSSDVSVTDQTDSPVLSLMTCVPVGTALNRLVVRSNLARTVPATAAAGSMNESLALFN